MISKNHIRWFLTILMVFIYYLGLIVFDLGFNLNISYDFSVLGEKDPISVWKAFVMSLLSAHNAVMSYVYVSTPILLILLFIIHKKIR